MAANSPDLDEGGDGKKPGSAEEEEQYHRKFQKMLEYIPFLETMIQKLERAGDKSREAQLLKMKSLHAILSNTKRKLKIETLQRCEDVLKKLMVKVEMTDVKPPALKGLDEDSRDSAGSAFERTCGTVSEQCPEVSDSAVSSTTLEGESSVSNIMKTLKMAAARTKKKDASISSHGNDSSEKSTHHDESEVTSSQKGSSRSGSTYDLLEQGRDHLKKLVGNLSSSSSPSSGRPKSPSAIDWKFEKEPPWDHCTSPLSEGSDSIDDDLLFQKVVRAELERNRSKTEVASSKSPPFMKGEHDTIWAKDAPLSKHHSQPSDEEDFSRNYHSVNSVVKSPSRLNFSDTRLQEDHIALSGRQNERDKPSKSSAVSPQFHLHAGNTPKAPGSSHVTTPEEKKEADDVKDVPTTPRSIREKLEQEIHKVHRVGVSTGGALRALVGKEDRNKVQLKNCKNESNDKFPIVRSPPGRSPTNRTVPQLKFLEGLDKVPLKDDKFNKDKNRDLTNKLMRSDSKLERPRDPRRRPSIERSPSPNRTVRNMSISPPSPPPKTVNSNLANVPRSDLSNAFTSAANDGKTGAASTVSKLSTSNSEDSKQSTSGILSKMTPKELERIVTLNLRNLPDIPPITKVLIDSVIANQTSASGSRNSVNPSVQESPFPPPSPIESVNTAGFSAPREVHNLPSQQQFGVPRPIPPSREDPRISSINTQRTQPLLPLPNSSQIPNSPLLTSPTSYDARYPSPQMSCFPTPTVNSRLQPNRPMNIEIRSTGPYSVDPRMNAQISPSTNMTMSPSLNVPMSPLPDGQPDHMRQQMVGNTPGHHGIYHQQPQPQPPRWAGTPCYGVLSHGSEPQHSPAVPTFNRTMNVYQKQQIQQQQQQFQQLQQQSEYDHFNRVREMQPRSHTPIPRDQFSPGGQQQWPAHDGAPKPASSLIGNRPPFMNDSGYQRLHGRESRFTDSVNMYPGNRSNYSGNTGPRGPSTTSGAASERDPRRRSADEERTRKPFNQDDRRPSRVSSSSYDRDRRGESSDRRRNSDSRDSWRHNSSERRNWETDSSRKSSSSAKPEETKKDETDIISPLNSLYGTTAVPKTGKGYGFQNFRIPKIKRDPPRPKSPPRSASPIELSAGDKEKQVDGSEAPKIDGGKGGSLLEKNEKENDSKEQVPKLKEEITQEWIETLIRKSFESGEGKKLFEQTKFLEKLSENLKAKKFRKIKRILESDSDESGSDDEKKIDNKSLEKENDLEDNAEIGIKKNKTTKVLIVTDEEDDAIKEEVKKEEVEEKQVKPSVVEKKVKGTPGRKKKEPKNEVDVLPKDEEENKPTITEQEETKQQKKPNKRRSALELLQNDIRDMFISKGVVTATGYRMCRLLKEAQPGMSLEEISRSEAKRMQEEAAEESDTSSMMGKKKAGSEISDDKVDKKQIKGRGRKKGNTGKGTAGKNAVKKEKKLAKGWVMEEYEEASVEEVDEEEEEDEDVVDVVKRRGRKSKTVVVEDSSTEGDRPLDSSPLKQKKSKKIRTSSKRSTGGGGAEKELRRRALPRVMLERLEATSSDEGSSSDFSSVSLYCSEAKKKTPSSRGVSHRGRRGTSSSGSMPRRAQSSGNNGHPYSDSNSELHDPYIPKESFRYKSNRKRVNAPSLSSLTDVIKKLSKNLITCSLDDIFPPPRSPRESITTDQNNMKKRNNTSPSKNKDIISNNKAEGLQKDENSDDKIEKDVSKIANNKEDSVAALDSSPDTVITDKTKETDAQGSPALSADQPETGPIKLNLVRKVQRKTKKKRTKWQLGIIKKKPPNKLKTDDVSGAAPEKTIVKARKKVIVHKKHNAEKDSTVSEGTFEEVVSTNKEDEEAEDDSFSEADKLKGNVDASTHGPVDNVKLTDSEPLLDQEIVKDINDSSEPTGMMDKSSVAQGGSEDSDVTRMVTEKGMDQDENNETNEVKNGENNTTINQTSLPEKKDKIETNKNKGKENITDDSEMTEIKSKVEVKKRLNKALTEKDFVDINYVFDHTASKTICKLCSTHAKTIVQHYKNVHPENEVLISRLAIDEAQRAISESEQNNYNDVSLLTEVSQAGKRKIPSLFACRMCNHTSIYALNFYEHMSGHTGEYRYQCCKCPYESATRTTFKGHFYNHHPQIKLKQGLSFRLLAEGPSNNITTLFGYLCSLCNFVQLKKENLEKHVSLRHEKASPEAKIIIVNLSKVSSQKGEENSAAGIEYDISETNSIDAAEQSIEESKTETEISFEVLDSVDDSKEYSDIIQEEVDDELVSESNTDAEAPSRNEEVVSEIVTSPKKTPVEAFICLNEIEEDDTNVEFERSNRMQEIDKVLSIETLFQHCSESERDFVFGVIDRLHDSSAKIDEAANELCDVQKTGATADSDDKDTEAEASQTLKETDKSKNDSTSIDVKITTEAVEAVTNLLRVETDKSEKERESIREKKQRIAARKIAELSAIAGKIGLVSPSKLNPDDLGDRRVTRSLSKTEEDGMDADSDLESDSNNSTCYEVTDESDVEIIGYGPDSNTFDESGSLLSFSDSIQRLKEKIKEEETDTAVDKPPEKDQSSTAPPFVGQELPLSSASVHLTSSTVSLNSCDITSLTTDDTLSLSGTLHEPSVRNGDTIPVTDIMTSPSENSTPPSSGQMPAPLASDDTLPLSENASQESIETIPLSSDEIDQIGENVMNSKENESLMPVIDNVISLHSTLGINSAAAIGDNSSFTEDGMNSLLSASKVGAKPPPTDALKDRPRIPTLKSTGNTSVVQVACLEASKCNNITTYLCRKSGCIFSCTDLDSFTNHLLTTHLTISWDGMCGMCNGHVVSTEDTMKCTFPLHLALVHMVKVHLSAEEPGETTSLNESPETISAPMLLTEEDTNRAMNVLVAGGEETSNSGSGETEPRKFGIRIRRMSGDMLSLCKEPEELEINTEPEQTISDPAENLPNSETIEDVESTNDDDCPFLRIESVVSLNPNAPGNESVDNPFSLMGLESSPEKQTTLFPVSGNSINLSPVGYRRIAPASPSQGASSVITHSPSNQIIRPLVFNCKKRPCYAENPRTSPLKARLTYSRSGTVRLIPITAASSSTITLLPNIPNTVTHRSLVSPSTITLHSDGSGNLTSPVAHKSLLASSTITLHSDGAAPVHKNLLTSSTIPSPLMGLAQIIRPVSGALAKDDPLSRTARSRPSLSEKLTRIKAGESLVGWVSEAIVPTSSILQTAIITTSNTPLNPILTSSNTVTKSVLRSLPNILAKSSVVTNTVEESVVYGGIIVDAPESACGIANTSSSTSVPETVPTTVAEDLPTVLPSTSADELASDTDTALTRPLSPLTCDTQQKQISFKSSLRTKLPPRGSLTFENTKESKHPDTYQEMLKPEKLRHLFKCMGRPCAFTTNSHIRFQAHIVKLFISYENFNAQPKDAASSPIGAARTRPAFSSTQVQQDWMQCCYCGMRGDYPEHLVQHILTEHGHSLYQCAYCFFRARTHSYVVLHQNTCHISECVSVLLCQEAEGIPVSPDLIRPLDEVVLPYICIQGGCGEKYLIPDVFQSHLETAHSQLTCYYCHLCTAQCLKPAKLIVHYKLHSYCQYQCRYCVHGTDTKEEMQHHLCNSHCHKQAQGIVRMYHSLSYERWNSPEPQALVPMDLSDGPELEGLLQITNPLNSPDDSSQDNLYDFWRHFDSDTSNPCIFDGVLPPDLSEQRDEIVGDPTTPLVIDEEAPVTNAPDSVDDVQPFENSPLLDLSSTTPDDEQNSSLTSVDVQTTDALSPTASEERTTAPNSTETSPLIVSTRSLTMKPEMTCQDNLSGNESDVMCIDLEEDAINVETQKGSNKGEEDDEIQVLEDKGHVNRKETVKRAWKPCPIKVSDEQVISLSDDEVTVIDDSSTNKNILSRALSQIVPLPGSNSANIVSKIPAMLTDANTSTVNPSVHISDISSLPNTSNMISESSDLLSTSQIISVVTDTSSIKSVTSTLSPNISVMEPKTGFTNIKSLISDRSSNITVNLQANSSNIQSDDSQMSTENTFQTSGNSTINKEFQDFQSTVSGNIQDEFQQTILEEPLVTLKHRNPLTVDRIANAVDPLSTDSSSRIISLFSGEPLVSMRITNPKIRDQLANAVDPLGENIEKGPDDVMNSTEIPLEADSKLVTPEKYPESEISERIRKLIGKGSSNEQEDSLDVSVNIIPDDPESNTLPMKETTEGGDIAAKPSVEDSGTEGGLSTTEDVNKDTGLSGEELYRCGNVSCSFSAPDMSLLRDHLLICDFSRDTTGLQCAHCSRQFKLLNSLLEHLRVHGTSRYGCALCTYRAPVPQQVVKHLKSHHRVNNTRIVPLDPRHVNPDTAMFVLFPKDEEEDYEREDDYVSFMNEGFLHEDRYDSGFSTDVPHEAAPAKVVGTRKTNRAVSKDITLRKRRNVDEDGSHRLKDKIKGKSGKNSNDPRFKRNFHPDEHSLLPTKTVVLHPLTCGVCTFKTKVVGNMRRHLRIHDPVEMDLEETEIPDCESVNPVPCLEKKEMMFDKMTNLAASSHASGRMGGKPASTPGDRNLQDEIMKLPKFVPENQRYVCGAPGCSYLTCDETMLRYHLRALHFDETAYRCPHCPESAQQEPTGLAISIDRLGAHLRMHDNRLYKCAHCSYNHFQRHVVERHLSDKHPEKRQFVHVVREPEGEGSSGKGDVAGKGEQGGFPVPSGVQPVKHPWRCGLCKFRCATRSEVIEHAAASHGIKSQFKCGLCSYRSSSRPNFETHFAARHPGSDLEIIHVYRRVEESVSGNASDAGAGIPGTSVDATSSTSSGITFDTTPIWRRDMYRVRHIRGILLEDEEETRRHLLPAPSVSTISAPPPPAEEIRPPSDELEEKFGPYGQPAPGGLFVCTRCNKYRTRFKADMRDHLHRELDYMRWVCTHCGTMACSKSQLQKHSAKVHDKDRKPEAIAQLTPDLEIEQWVDNLLSHQHTLIRAASEAVSATTSGSTEQAEGVEEAAVTKRRANESWETPQAKRVPRNETSPAVVKDVNCLDVAEDDGVIDIEAMEDSLLADEGAKKVEKESKFACKSCNAKFQMVRGLKIHVRHTHLKLGGWKCGYCEVTAFSEYMIKVHSRSAHPDQPEMVVYNENLAGVKLDDSFWEREYGILPASKFGSTSDDSGPARKRRRMPDSEGSAQETGEPSAASEAEVSDEVVVLSDGKSKCSYCNYHCKSTSDLRNHEMRHWVQKPFKCGYCEVEAIREYEIKKHCLRTHPLNKVLIIDKPMPPKPDIKPLRWSKKQPELQSSEGSVLSDMDSPMTTPISTPIGTPEKKPKGKTLDMDSYKEEEKEGEISTSSSKIFRCFYCPLRATSLSTVHEHWQKIHKVKIAGASGILKQGLPFRYKEVNVDDLIKGKERMCKKKGVFVCQYCKRRGTLDSITVHHKEMHPDKPFKAFQSSVTQYRCGLCQFVACTVGTLRKHFDIEHTGEEFRYMVKPAKLQEEGQEPCEDLTESVKDTTSSLPSPSSSEPSSQIVAPVGGQLSCSWCDETCENEQKMKLHHTMYHSHLQFKCVVVPDSQPNSVSQESSSFRCPKCSFSSNSHAKVTEHLRRHAKPFKCGYCSAMFSFPTKVRMHSNTAHPSLQVSIICVKEAEIEMKELEDQIICLDQGMDVLSETSNDAVPQPQPPPPTESAPIRRSLAVARKSTSLSSIVHSGKRRFLAVARKSTNSLPRLSLGQKSRAFLVDAASDVSAIQEQYSFYGQKPVLGDLSRITTEMLYGTSMLNIKYSTLSQILNLNPIVKVLKMQMVPQTKTLNVLTLRRF